MQVPIRRSHQSCPTCTCSTGGVVRWRPIVLVLLFVAAWDTFGLLIGDNFYVSPSYDVLRDIAGTITIGGQELGMRAYGVGIGLIGGSLSWMLLAGRRHQGHVSWRLRLALSGLAAWWVAWCVGIAATFFVHGQVFAWGGLGKLVGISAIAVIAARVPPPAVRELSDPSPEEGSPPRGR